VKNLARHLFVALLVFAVALPFLWMAYAAFLPPELVYAGEITRLGFSLENFRALAPEGFWGRLVYSLGVSGLATLLSLLTGFPAAYALREGAPLLGLYLFLLAVPAEMLLVPLYGVLAGTHLLGSPWALVWPFAASPFVVFLLYQGLRSVPWQVVEAARIDGAGEGVVLVRVLLPMMAGHLVTAGVLSFAAHWNLVLYPRVMTSETWWTLQVWMADLVRKYPSDWGLLSAAALLGTLPLAGVYLLFERKIVETFEGSLKG